MASSDLIVEAFVGEEVFITGVWGNANILELEAIEKELKVTYDTSNNFDDWFDIRCKVTYENGAPYDPSYWFTEEIGRKPCGSSADIKLSEYLNQFDKDEVTA